MLKELKIPTMVEDWFNMKQLLSIIEKIMFRCEGLSTDYKTLVDIGFATLEFDISKANPIPDFSVDNISTIKEMIVVLEDNGIFLTSINNIKLTTTSDRVVMLEVLKNSYSDYKGFKTFSTVKRFLTEGGVVSVSKMTKAYHMLMSNTKTGLEINMLDTEWAFYKRLAVSPSILKKELGID